MLTFETKVYEKDWEFLLKGRQLDRMIKNCRYEFAEKILMINNVNSPYEVMHYAQLAIERGIIDKYYFVEDYAPQVMSKLNLTKESFKGGYYYSIAELVSINVCKTAYLLHFSSDSFITNSTPKWIDLGLHILMHQPEVLVVNPLWNAKVEEARSESILEHDSYFESYGFSDQCYLIRTADFQQNIYSEHNEVSSRYPKYGGELFEKRVDSYMRNHSLKRAVIKTASYTHVNFPSNKFIRFLLKSPKYPFRA